MFGQKRDKPVALQLDHQSTHAESDFAYHTRQAVTPLTLHKSKSTVMENTRQPATMLHRAHTQIESTTTPTSQLGTGLGCSAFKMAAFNYKQQIENARAQRVDLVS